MHRDPVDRLIDMALKEDIGRGDITTRLLISNSQISRAVIVCRENAILCGFEVALKIFRRLDPNIKSHRYYKDGDKVIAGTVIMTLEGKTRALLTAERVALNFLCHLSGVATQAMSFMEKIRPYKAKIMDTRKTIPGLRKLQKNAIRCAKAVNHRIDLSEMILIKDNHLAACQDKIPLPDTIHRTRRLTKKPIEVEIKNLKEFRQALNAQPDVILLDNMNLRQIKKAVTIRNKRSVKKRPLLEVSGNVNLHNVRQIAQTGVDQISVGSLTHTIKAIDIS